VTDPRLRSASLALVPLLLCGCVLPDQIASVQADVADVKRRLGEIERSQRDVERSLEELRASASGGEDDEVRREELADIQLRVERLTREGTVTQERIGDVERRIERIAQDLAQPRDLARGGPSGERIETGPGAIAAPAAPLEPVPADSAAVPDPEALYNTAYLDFSKGNFELAIAGFDEYQQRFPDSPLADNALYWIGECHFSKGDYGEAIRAFDRLLEVYARSDKAAAADLKKALAFQEQNMIGQAIVQLRYVIEQYPDTDESRIARDKLSALGQAPS
jgi:tol-pal system protein YbgF